MCQCVCVAVLFVCSYHGFFLRNRRWMLIIAHGTFMFLCWVLIRYVHLLSICRFFLWYLTQVLSLSELLVWSKIGSLFWSQLFSSLKQNSQSSIYSVTPLVNNNIFFYFHYKQTKDRIKRKYYECDIYCEMFQMQPSSV